EALLRASDAALAAAGIDDEGLRRLREPDPAALDALHRWLDAPGHALVTCDSPDFPQRLAETDDPPLALFVDGARPELLGGPQLAIVGSRNATRSGRETALRLAEYLCRSGLTVTSGLAVGIDAASHEGAL